MGKTITNARNSLSDLKYSDDLTAVCAEYPYNETSVFNSFQVLCCDFLMIICLKYMFQA